MKAFKQKNKNRKAYHSPSAKERDSTFPTIQRLMLTDAAFSFFEAMGLSLLKWSTELKAFSRIPS